MLKSLANIYAWLMNETLFYYPINDSRLKPEVIYPGSFNPLHEGHLYNFSLIDNNKIKAFEICVSPRSKTLVTLEDLSKRIEQFEGKGPVIITNATYMKDKIACMPFVEEICMGVDTAIRFLDDDGKNNIENMPVKFHIFDREDKTLNDIKSPPSNFSRLEPKDKKYLYVSSTKIREEKT